MRTSIALGEPYSLLPWRKPWENRPGVHTDACLKLGQKEVDSNEVFELNQQASPDLRSRFLGLESV
jgi:hypothetical protein